jgi:hypothetical protein
MSAKTPGAIQRDGTFLWQMDSPSGAGINLWSGKLSANNGYPQEHVERAAALFVAAPDLLAALKLARDYIESDLLNRQAAYAGYPHKWSTAQEDLSTVDRAIAKAEGSTS